MDSITEAYIALQTEFLKNTKPGDRFRVLRKSYRGEMGYDAYWNPNMDDIVGKVGVLKEVLSVALDKGVGLRFDSGEEWWVPWFILEPLPTPVKVVVGTEEFSITKEKAAELRKLITS